MLQSPARLGLTNPNSPSLQNPTPPKLPHQQPQQLQPSSNFSSAISTTTTTSSTLLSLLPPLPRAQTLLLQMAALASKLFELSPNRSLWLTAFRGSLPTFLSSQTQALPSTTPLDSSPSSTKEIISLFNRLQTQLFEAVAELQEILDLQDAKRKAAREIQSKDSALLAFANKLKDAERVLDILVDDYSDYRRPKRSKLEDDMEEDSSCTTTVASQLKLSDILSCAHRISYTTFAPPEFGAGQAPLRGALPPAPQEEQMRASQLYSFADLDVGLPKAEESEKTIEAIIEPPAAQPAEVNPLSNLSAIQGLLPPNITVPSGWKPGMPVELPINIPMPPPGWKPGDPVPLPPFTSLPGPRADEQQLRPIAPSQHKPPETIQVRHVELDILDQDDDSSDYSSEDASSEDDD
ncbi:mediator of RNA polymerase II transcription subunit 4 [Corylus avellana]|uniref:mediator of RNA polymerase II transcription subunit 4 n=1 Tax=Corylus avellana TaxID=13451 RepID=UPI001E23A115|nr:mediator of RNA polymerase II transcription subunit 4 [Corylus avellana]